MNAREHHLGYVVVEVGDEKDIIPVLLPADTSGWRPQIRIARKKAFDDLVIAKKRWPRSRLRVVRVSGFLSGRRPS